MTRPLCECLPANRRDAETHSPGPWMIADDRSGYVLGSGVSTLAVARGYTDANVRLIAAAPDLLELAKLFERSVLHYIALDMHIGDEEGARMKTVTLNMVRAVIARAESQP